MIRPKGPVIAAAALACLGKACALAGFWSGLLSPQQQKAVEALFYLCALGTGGLYAAALSWREGSLLSACLSFPGSGEDNPALSRLNDSFAVFATVMWSLCLTALIVQLMALVK